MERTLSFGEGSRGLNHITSFHPVSRSVAVEICFNFSCTFIVYIGDFLIAGEVVLRCLRISLNLYSNFSVFVLIGDFANEVDSLHE